MLVQACFHSDITDMKAFPLAFLFVTSLMKIRLDTQYVVYSILFFISIMFIVVVLVAYISQIFTIFVSQKIAKFNTVENSNSRNVIFAKLIRYCSECSIQCN